MRGRAMTSNTLAMLHTAGVLMLASYGITPISLALAGFLVSWNLKFMFLLAGGVMLMAAAGAALSKPVREIDKNLIRRVRGRVWVKGSTHLLDKIRSHIAGSEVLAGPMINRV
jgi:hypothetical protein